MADIVQSIRAIPIRPSIDLSARSYIPLLIALVLGAAALQILFYMSGLYSISADESARALFAHDLNFDNALELTFWTPLNKIVNGLALKVYDDVYVTPRVLNGLIGLGTLAAVAMLAYRLFDNRLIAIVAGALALALPQRLILSVAPLSDMQVYFLTLLAAGFLVTWMRNGSEGALIGASALLLLASMVRFESWFLNALLGLYIFYRWAIRRDLAFVPFMVSGVLLSAFPLYWLGKIYILDGSLERLGITSMQFIDVYGRNYIQAIKSDVLILFAKDVLMNPAALFGALALVLLFIKEPVLRHWTSLLFAPLLILAVLMVVTLSVPMAAPFRIDGIWVLLLLPFSAWLIVTIADHLRASVLVRAAAIAVLVYIGFMGSLLESHATIKDYHAGAKDLIVKEDLVMGDALRAILASDPRNVVVDAIDNLSFLNAAVVANAPERMIANVDNDLVMTGIYATSRQKYVANGRQDIVDAYLTDRFNIEGGLDAHQIAVRNVGFFLLRNENYIVAADANPLLNKRGQFGAWALYEVKA